ncbi:MAG: BspA family leucine-rich repeat surface protein [Candidatus Nanosynbacter sp.]|nr:BspA family leucine-rich repeat surface protein [Candidatus Nanosynbacter sp.]
MSVKRKLQQNHQGRSVFQYLLTFILSNFLCILFSQSTFAAPNISISITGDTSVHAIFPTSGKVEASKTADITVNSDGVFGYKLFMSSDSENTALTSPDASNADYISSVSGSDNKLSEDMHNQYGYNIKNTDNKLYNAIPALGTPEMIKRVKTKLKSADIIKFNLGFELENTITPGSYKRKLIFSLISDEQASAQLVSGREINKALKRPTGSAYDDPLESPLWNYYDINIRVGVEKCEEDIPPENISIISVPDSEVEVYLGVLSSSGQTASYHACIWSYATELIFPEDLSYMYAGFQSLNGDAGFSFYDGRSVSMLNFKKTKDISHLFHTASPRSNYIDTSTLKFFELFKNSPIENAESIFENSGVYKIGSDFESIANKAKNFKNAFKNIELNIDYSTTNWLFDNAEDTSSMFEDFKSSEIKLPNATFAKVKNADSMFRNVKSLSTFDINQATFAAAEDVTSMFEDVYFKDTLKMNSATFLAAKNASNMFKNSEISSIPFASNVFKSLDNAESMFENAKSDNVKFSNTTFQNVKNTQNMFKSVEINTVSLPSATFNSVVNANAMFMESKISTLHISQATFANAEDLSSMFEDTPTELVDINLQSATFAHAKNAHRMFYWGRATSVNLANAVFNELEDASSMFEDQDYLTEIKLPNATFDKTRNFNRTFFSVTAVTIISLPKITFRAAEDLTSMFHDCYYMATLNLNPSKMIASHVVTMESMFKGTSSMTEINLEKLSINGGTLQNIQEIFKDNDNSDTEKIILPTVFDTSNVTNMASAFENCKTLTEIGNYGQLNLKSVTNASRLFAGDQSLDLKQIIPLLKTNSIENASFMFYLAYSSAPVAFSNNFKTNSTTTMQGMFQGFMTPSLDISHFSLENTTTMEDMFSGKEASTWAVGGQYYAVSEVIWPNSIVNAPHLTTMKSLFHKNYHITKLNLPKFVSPALTDTSFMFFQLAKGITEIGVNGLDTQNVEDMSEMFEGLQFDRGSLGGSFAPKFKTTSLKNMYGMFYGMDVDHLDLTALDISNVTNMEYALSGSTYTTIDLTGWNTSNVENMKYLFWHSDYLTTIYASDSFVTTKVTQSDGIFNMNSGSDNLVGGNGTHAADQDITYARIDRPGKPGAFTLK